MSFCGRSTGKVKRVKKEGNKQQKERKKEERENERDGCNRKNKKVTSEYS